MSRVLGSILVLAIAILLCPSLHAATINFDINLDGLQALPPVATPGHGIGTLTLNDVTGAYSISGNFYDLIGTAITAQLHGPAEVGESGSLIRLLSVDVGASSGAFSNANTFTAGQMTELQNGLYYVNITSTFRPSGEIRGQIIPSLVPEPGSLALFGFGGLALFSVAWRRLRRNDPS